MKEINLLNGELCQVDDADFNYLNQYNWKSWLSRGIKYAIRYSRKGSKTGNTRIIFMHREIMNTPDGMETDHIDGNGLNNQKNNLRICTKSENQRNKKMSRGSKIKYKGVSWCHYSIRARIKVNGVEHNLGYFKTAEEAARAYNDAAILYFGEFAQLNIIP